MGRISIESDLINADAFLGLSKWATKVYLLFLTKRVMVAKESKSRTKEWAIANNGKITFCYSEARAKGIGEREFRNAIDELIERGFLDLTHQGQGGLSHDMSKYFIDTRWEKWNTAEFVPATMPRKRNVKEGRGWQAHNAKQKQKLLTNMTDHRGVWPDKYDRPKAEKEMFRLTDLPDH